MGLDIDEEHKWRRWQDMVGTDREVYIEVTGEVLPARAFVAYTEDLVGDYLYPADE